MRTVSTRVTGIGDGAVTGGVEEQATAAPRSGGSSRAMAVE
jgi:hypothetical protein